VRLDGHTVYRKSSTINEIGADRFEAVVLAGSWAGY
jgi:hypothetical protein